MCLFLIVFAAMIPGLAVSNGFGLVKVFWFVETNCLLLKVLLSPITIWEEFLYGITTVGFGSLLLNAFGWYGSKGFLIIPAWRFSLTLYWSWEKAVTSVSLLEARSTGLAAPLLNETQTDCPFFCKILLQDVILVFLNMAAELAFFSARI